MNSNPFSRSLTLIRRQTIRHPSKRKFVHRRNTQLCRICLVFIRFGSLSNKKFVVCKSSEIKPPFLPHVVYRSTTSFQDASSSRGTLWAVGKLITSRYTLHLYFKGSSWTYCNSFPVYVETTSINIPELLTAQICQSLMSSVCNMHSSVQALTLYKNLIRAVCILLLSKSAVGQFLQLKRSAWKTTTLKISVYLHTH